MGAQRRGELVLLRQSFWSFGGAGTWAEQDVENWSLYQGVSTEVNMFLTLKCSLCSDHSTSLKTWKNVWGALFSLVYYHHCHVGSNLFVTNTHSSSPHPSLSGNSPLHDFLVAVYLLLVFPYNLKAFSRIPTSSQNFWFLSNSKPWENTLYVNNN